jgi:hypothetical protein
VQPTPPIPQQSSPPDDANARPWTSHVGSLARHFALTWLKSIILTMFIGAPVALAAAYLVGGTLTRFLIFFGVGFWLFFVLGFAAGFARAGTLTLAHAIERYQIASRTLDHVIDRLNLDMDPSLRRRQGEIPVARLGEEVGYFIGGESRPGQGPVVPAIVRFMILGTMASGLVRELRRYLGENFQDVATPKGGIHADKLRARAGALADQKIREHLEARAGRTLKVLVVITSVGLLALALFLRKYWI